MGRFDGYRKVDLDYVKCCEIGTEFLVHYVGKEWSDDYSDKAVYKTLIKPSGGAILKGLNGWLSISDRNGYEFDVYEKIKGSSGVTKIKEDKYPTNMDLLKYISSMLQNPDLSVSEQCCRIQTYQYLKFLHIYQ